MAVAVTVSTTPTLLIAARSHRERGSLVFEVRRGGQPVYISMDPMVTPETGFALEPTASNSSTLTAENEAFSKPASVAWYGCVASGEETVIIQEGPP